MAVKATRKKRRKMNFALTKSSLVNVLCLRTEATPKSKGLSMRDMRTDMTTLPPLRRTLNHPQFGASASRIFAALILRRDDRLPRQNLPSPGTQGDEGLFHHPILQGMKRDDNRAAARRDQPLKLPQQRSQLFHLPVHRDS